MDKSAGESKGRSGSRAPGKQLVKPSRAAAQANAAKATRKKMSIAVRPADLAWVQKEALRTGSTVSSIYTEAMRALRRRRAAQALLESFGDAGPLSDAMFAFLRAEQSGSDPDVSSIGAAWASVVSSKHDAAARALVEHYAQERIAGRVTRGLVAETLAGLRRLSDA